MFKIFSLIFILLIAGCSSEKDNRYQTHVHQDPLPDYWESWHYEQTHLSRIDRIERKHRKKIKELEEKYAKPKRPKPEKFYRPIQEDQEIKANRDGSPN